MSGFGTNFSYTWSTSYSQVVQTSPCIVWMVCRYCEFNKRVDPTRGASWNKIAAMLLVMHCSEYVMGLDSGMALTNSAGAVHPD